ncbi:MAG: PQQ-like beta-propeller repeat protein [Verrucomicrobia bacterium]|nr:PQQ-like beta-propeller repeat protein [Verrucomicrobiota bacterium]
MVRAWMQASGALIGAALSWMQLMAAPDWPEFRGPTGQGISTATSVPLQWSANSNVVWKVEVPGEGWSSPVLSQGELYLTTAVTPSSGGVQLRALSFAAETGKLRWDTEVFLEPGTGGGMHQKNSKASPTPVVSGDWVYVHFGHLGTAGLDRAGKVHWRQSELKYSPVHGNGGSPILADGVLFFSCDGGSGPFAVALDPETGAIRWRVDRETAAAKKFSFSTALFLTNGTRKEIISPGSGAVFSYDPATGREWWRVAYGNGYSVVPRPVFAHGLIFVGTGYDRASLLAIRPGGEGDLTESNIVWQTARSAPNTPSVVVVGELIFFVSDGGIATCADARTGRVHWNERLEGDYSASPVWAEDRVYFFNEAGLCTVVRSAPKFEVLAKNDLGERLLASPAVTDGAWFIRTKSHLFRIGSPAPVRGAE